MGSATSHALTAVRGAVNAAGATDLDMAKGLLDAARVLAESAPLRTAITEFEASNSAKSVLVRSVFKESPASAVAILEKASAERWSNADDYVTAVEEAGIRIAASATASVNIDDELLSIERTIARNDGLILALGSNLSPTASKLALVHDLLGSHNDVSPATVAIVSHLVQSPRGRRIGAMLQHAAAIIADQRGYEIATVTSAAPLSEAQNERLVKSLSKSSTRTVKINPVIDPSVLGGVRIRLGDDVIDGTIATRLTTLKQKLAG